VLFAVIGGLLLFWWFRNPSAPVEQIVTAGGAAGPQGATVATPDALAELAELAPTATPLPTLTAQQGMPTDASPTVKGLHHRQPSTGPPAEHRPINRAPRPNRRSDPAAGVDPSVPEIWRRSVPLRSAATGYG
jgi:hypothetical protein